MSAEFSWKSWMQLIIALGLSYLFFYMMLPFIVPILLGAITALICHPTYKSMQRKLPRALSAVLVTFGVTAGILVPLIFLCIGAAQQALAWIASIRLPATGGAEGLLAHPVVERAIRWVTRFTPVDRDWLQAQSLSVMQSVLETVSGGIASFLGSMPGLLLVFVVVVISFYFFLVDGARFLRFLSALSPLARERTELLYNTFDNSCRGVVLGLFTSAVAQGAVITFLFLVTGLPNAFLMGVIGVVMGMVPVVGTAPITIGVVIYLFANGFTARGIIWTGAAVFIATIDNVIRTMIMKGASEMHPLLALVSAFGATKLMGPPGIFLGPIVAAVFVSFLQILALEIRRESTPSGG